MSDEIAGSACRIGQQLAMLKPGIQVRAKLHPGNRRLAQNHHQDDRKLQVRGFSAYAVSRMKGSANSMVAPWRVSRGLTLTHPYNVAGAGIALPLFIVR